MAVWTYPEIDPIAFAIGPVSVRWYGLAYLVAFLFSWWVLAHFNKRWNLGMSGDDLSTVMLAAVLGVIVGGRLGYVLFYNPSYYLAHPLQAFAVWDGGMSFHGGLAGIVLAGWIVSRFVGASFLRLCD